MDNAMTGHSNEHVGLQNHSVGEHYPLAVVGYGHPTLYVIENLETNEVLCGSYGAPYQHYESKYLYKIIGTAVRGLDSWVKGRPRFNANTKSLHMPLM
jgi:hypothetical protein